MLCFNGERRNTYFVISGLVRLGSRKISIYTAKINDIWAKNEINNNNNHRAS
jgi:hypothetical protein